MADFDPSICFLFDNGSLRAASTLSLRRIARRLQDRLAVAVKPVSLLHSSGVAADQLEGQPAELLEVALTRFAEVGGREAVLLPLFFGPSGALTGYVPERLAAIRTKFPLLEVRLAAPLISLTDDSAGLLAAEIAAEIATFEVSGAPATQAVVLVDHGSPQPAVTAVRDHLAAELRRRITESAVIAASMERRPGPEYAFNDPLLETALRDVAGQSGIREIIVALQFLQAGRHAGPGGDVAEICAAALHDTPDVRVRFTSLLGEGPTVLRLLERRWTECVAAYS